MALNKSTVKALDNYIDWKALFPRSGRPDLRKKLNRYQREKIAAVYADFNEAGGANKFHNIRKSAKRDLLQFSTGTRQVFKGYFTGMDMQVNRNGTIKSSYTDKHGTYREFIIKPFDSAPMTAGQLRGQIKKALAELKAKPAFVGIMNGSDIYQLTPSDRVELMISQTVKDFEKYAAMAAGNEKRTNGRIAAHPAKWMRGVTAQY